MTEMDADKLRALQIITLRNWQREMERSCDELRKLGPEMEEAALGNAHVAEALEDAADTILAMAEERDRLATLARANNDLARHEAKGRRELQAENARLREALQSTQAMLEAINHHNSTNMREVRERLITNGAALTPAYTDKGEGE